VRDIVPDTLGVEEGDTEEEGVRESDEPLDAVCVPVPLLLGVPEGLRVPVEVPDGVAEVDGVPVRESDGVGVPLVEAPLERVAVEEGVNDGVLERELVPLLVYVGVPDSEPLREGVAVREEVLELLTVFVGVLEAVDEEEGVTVGDGVPVCEDPPDDVCVPVRLLLEVPEGLRLPVEVPDGVALVEGVPDGDSVAVGVPLGDAPAERDAVREAVAETEPVREGVAEGERVRLREGVRVGERLGVPELVLEVPARKRGDQESKRRSASRMGIDKTEKVGAARKCNRRFATARVASRTGRSLRLAATFTAS
jgi:hypothetical protein